MGPRRCTRDSLPRIGLNIFEKIEIWGKNQEPSQPHHAPKKLHLLRMPNVSPNQVLYLRALLQRRVIRLLIVASAGRAGAACDGRGFTWANIAEIASQDDSC